MSDEGPLKGETKQEYAEDAAGYFKNLSSGPSKGPSADDMRVIEGQLPSKEKQFLHAERLERGFTKTSRSGSFTDKPHASAAIFPNGLKEASDFIDEMTPGKYQPQEPMKPPAERTGMTGGFPKPKAVVDICIDCMKQIDPTQYRGGLIPVMEEYEARANAIGLKLGDLIIYCTCTSCNEAAERLGRDARPLVLVKQGALSSEDDCRIADKYGIPINLHSGTEATYGQWLLYERLERIILNLWTYLRSEYSKGDSPVFRTRIIE